MMHADRTNRALLTLLGLLLLAAGVAGILAGTDILGHQVGNRSLIANPVGHYIGDNSAWFWPIAALAAAVLALLALRWLVAVLRPDARPGDIHIAAAPTTGRTTLDSGALRDALTAEIETYRGVDNARIRVLGTPDAPRLAVTVRVTNDSDLVALRRRLETQALQHARQVLDSPDLPIRLHLSLTNQTSRVI
jgi:hypothetical protein